MLSKQRKMGRILLLSKEPQKVLRAIREYVPAERLVQSLGVWDVIKRVFKRKSN